MLPLTLLLYTLGPVGIAIITAGSSRRRLTGLAAGFGLLIFPAFARESVSYIILLAITATAIVCFLHVVELAREQPSPPLLWRIIHIFLPFDSRKAKRTKPGFEARHAFFLLLWLGLLEAIPFRRFFDGPPLIRWVSAGIGFDAFLEMMFRAVVIVCAAVGYCVPLLHNNPFLSRSLQEFWGRRWNQLMGNWLKGMCYLPLAVRGHARLGTIVAFASSALWHWYLARILLNWKWALLMASFFLIQNVLIFAESRLRMQGRPLVVRHVWTIAAVLLPSPLVIEPCIRMIKHLQ